MAYFGLFVSNGGRGGTLDPTLRKVGGVHRARRKERVVVDLVSFLVLFGVCSGAWFKATVDHFYSCWFLAVQCDHAVWFSPHREVFSD